MQVELRRYYNSVKKEGQTKYIAARDKNKNNSVVCKQSKYPKPQKKHISCIRHWDGRPAKKRAKLAKNNHLSPENFSRRRCTISLMFTSRCKFSSSESIIIKIWLWYEISVNNNTDLQSVRKVLNKVVLIQVRQTKNS